MVVSLSPNKILIFSCCLTVITTCAVSVLAAQPSVAITRYVVVLSGCTGSAVSGLVVPMVVVVSGSLYHVNVYALPRPPVACAVRLTDCSLLMVVSVRGVSCILL